ncbi:MAG TPA: D-alanyl-D-alanine carboxypeptidase family protein [Thermodesulfovibrionales bacterium]|nr:D-alanyl-D-alanine carboxypeptidase family protein [Thermodesulfovibrionales bacterium]
MRKKFKVQSSKFKVRKRYFLSFIVALLFTFYCSLFTVYADTVHSRAAVVMDASTGNLLYAKNPDLRCPPASTTKLMTAIVAIENLPLTHVVTISKNASQVSPHKAGFKEGDKVTVEELLYAALLGSANDAAVALAEAVAGTEDKFAALMNKKASLIGARDTQFINANGLPGPGQYITASDLSKIMNYALNYPKLKQIINTRVAEISTEKGRSISLRNTNRLLWSEEGLVGGKTGYTRTARHCFVCVAERENDTVVVALLGSPSRSDLWRESGLLIGKGFEILSNVEEPVIYLAKVDDIPLLVKSSQKKKSHLIKKKRSKSKKGKTLIAKKSGEKKKTTLAKKKGKKKILVKYKGKKKNYRVATKDSIAKNKG